MTDKLAGHTTHETRLWLRGQRLSGANWFRQCLNLQHTARDIPAVFPTAFSAQLATPKSERVPHVADLRGGMIGYTKGSDPAGHVFYILGRRPGFDLANPDGVLCESNDVVAGKTGHVGIVTLSFFRVNWGHTWQFGATMLNGYDFADFNAKPKPVHPTLGGNYEAAIKAVKKAVASHKKDRDDTLYLALKRDLARMQKRYDRYKPAS